MLSHEVAPVDPVSNNVGISVLEDMNQNISAPGPATGMTPPQYQQRQQHQQLVLQMTHFLTYIEGLPQYEARLTMAANLQNTLRQKYEEQSVVNLSRYILSMHDNQSLLNMLTDPLGIRLKQALTELAMRMRQQEAARQQTQNALQSGALGVPTTHTSAYAIDPTSQALMLALQEWQNSHDAGSLDTPAVTTQPSDLHSSPSPKASMTGQGHHVTRPNAMSTASMTSQTPIAAGYSPRMLRPAQQQRHMSQEPQSQLGMDLRATSSPTMAAQPSAAEHYSSPSTSSQQRRASESSRSTFQSPVTMGPPTTGGYSPATASGDQQQQLRSDQPQTAKAPSSRSAIAQPSDTDDDQSRAMRRAQQLLQIPHIPRQGLASPGSASMTGMSAQAPAPLGDHVQMAMALQRQQQHRAQQQEHQFLGFHTSAPVLRRTFPWHQRPSRARNQPAGGVLYFTQPVVGPAPVRSASRTLSSRLTQVSRNVQPAAPSPARSSPLQQTESPRDVQPAVSLPQTTLLLKRQSSERSGTPPDEEAERSVALKRARPLQQVVEDAHLTASRAEVDTTVEAQDKVAGWHEASPTSRKPLPHVFVEPADRSELGEDYTFALQEWTAEPIEPQPFAENSDDPPQWTGGPDERRFSGIARLGRTVDTPAITSQTAAIIAPLIATQGRQANMTEEDRAQLCAQAHENRGNLWDAMQEYREARGYQQDHSPHEGSLDDDMRLWRESGEESLGSDLFRGNPEDDLLS